MDSFIKTEDFDFSSDSPIYDFSAGFEAMPGAFMPDHDSSGMYGYGTSSPTSGGSSPTYSMSVDSNYPPPPQLSNNHRHPRFLNRNAWAGPDPSQRQPMPGPARPYGAPVRRTYSFHNFFTFLSRFADAPYQFDLRSAWNRAYNDHEIGLIDIKSHDASWDVSREQFPLIVTVF